VKANPPIQRKQRGNVLESGWWVLRERRKGSNFHVNQIKSTNAAMIQSTGMGRAVLHHVGSSI